MNQEKNIGSVVYKTVYERILKASDTYYSHQDGDISFSYEIDEKYISELGKLTTVEGFEQIWNKDETQTFINATNWVSKVLLSEKSTVIEPICSYDLIQNVQNGLYGANCYAHAVVLNDVFRLLGFKCKYVFCLPIDYHYTDNHVVNLVYSEQKNKWMLFDSAQNLYYTNKDGSIMDLRELRKSFVEDKPVNVCLLDEFWSALEYKEKIMLQNKTLVYMMKNTYRVCCFQNAFMDRLATNRKVIQYHLVPSNYIATPFIHTYYNTRSNTKHVEIYSSDEDAFWMAPKGDYVCN